MDGVTEHHQAYSRTRRPAPDSLRCTGAEVFFHDLFEIVVEDAEPPQLLPVFLFGEERFAPKEGARLDDGLFERQMLEGVERIVVNEDGNGALGGKKARRAVDDVLDSTRPPAGGRLGLGLALLRSDLPLRYLLTYNKSVRRAPPPWRDLVGPAVLESHRHPQTRCEGLHWMKVNVLRLLRLSRQPRGIK
jgi:hypothetical protein